MSDTAKFPLSIVLENQEDRLQFLERERIEVAAQMAEQTTTLKVIKEEISDLNASVKETNKSLAEFAKSVVEEEAKIKQRVTMLEKRERSEVEKTKWYRKLAYALIVGGGGALGTWFLEHFMNHSG